MQLVTQFHHSVYPLFISDYNVINASTAKKKASDKKTNYIKIPQLTCWKNIHCFLQHR
jgi:hypothetical protein